MIPKRPKLESRLDLSGVTIETLITAIQSALERSDKLDDSVAVVVRKRTMTIEGQINKLRNWVKTHPNVYFRDLLSAETNHVEISITLLALLELIKRFEVDALQPIPFGPIEIRQRLDT